MTVTSTVNDNTHILQTAHIAPVVLALLLKKNGISVPAGSLHQACENAQVEGASLRPAARLTNIMNGLQKKNLQVAQLRWDRMDRRQLPALVWHNEQWNYVDHGEEDTVLLTNANSETVLLPADKLEAAPVLWLRLSVAEPGATELLQSGASRLLLEEVFNIKSNIFFELKEERIEKQYYIQETITEKSIFKLLGKTNTIREVINEEIETMNESSKKKYRERFLEIID